MEQITPEQYNELKNAGYSDDEIVSALSKMDDDPRQHSQMSSFVPATDDNLIKWQLELNDILERAEHILRGDVPKYRNGILIWGKSPHPDKNPFNEWGIQEIMKILSMYINRNTILSDYNNEEINYKVFDFGRRLNNFIFMRYDEIGLDTEEKRKNYEMIVGELVDLVHSAYKRALHGGERRSLREMIQVTQSHQSSGGMMQPLMVEKQRERNTLNPMRYMKGKYV